VFTRRKRLNTRFGAICWIELPFDRMSVAAPLPLAHCVLIMLQRTFLGFLYAETQYSKNPPKLGCAKPDAILALDDSTHALECPELGAKTVLDRVL